VTYQWAVGYDNEAGYADFDPQPSTNAIIKGRRTIAGDRHMYTDGYQESALVFTAIDEDDEADLLSDLGLDAAESVELTITLRTNEDRSVWGDYNVIMYAPDFGRGDGDYPSLRRWAEDLVLRVSITGTT
jgi:hypothetical protein